MVQGVRSDDPALQLEATKELRKFVSKGINIIPTCIVILS